MAAEVRWLASVLLSGGASPSASAPSLQTVLDGGEQRLHRMVEVLKYELSKTTSSNREGGGQIEAEVLMQAKLVISADSLY